MSGRVLIVVPTYNERENVGPLIGELLALGPDIDVWVAGFWYTSSGLPICSACPAFITIMRCASVIASTWSCVT